MKKLLSTFKQSFLLLFTYRVNSIIYRLKQLPIIKRLIPEKAYQSKGLKIFAAVISGIRELCSFFFTKPLYVLLMVVLPSTLYNKDLPFDNLVIHIFLLLTIIGALLNSNLFNPTKDKYYGIMLLRMNANKYILSNYIYFLLKNFLGMMAIFIVMGFLSKIPFYLSLVLPILVVATKNFYNGFLISKTEKTGKVYNENKPNSRIWFFVAVILAAAYGLPVIGVLIGKKILMFFFAIIIVLGTWGTFKLFRFEDYRKVARHLLAKENIIFNIKETSAKVAKESYAGKIDVNTEISTNKTGYSYFHQIFMTRHRKILTKSAKNTTIIASTLVVLLNISVVFFEELREGVNEMTLTWLPYFLFIMYFVNRGQVFTQAIFMNCDHGMLNYSFYRRPDAILNLFGHRLKSLTVINLMPTLPIAIGLPMALYLSGGTTEPLNYGILFTSIIAISVFFSVHHLAIYYLLQPYNAEVEVKSFAYQIINTITYVLCYAGIHIKVSTFIFGIGTIVFALVYIVVALMLAYKMAPRTFRLK